MSDDYRSVRDKTVKAKYGEMPASNPEADDPNHDLKVWVLQRAAFEEGFRAGWMSRGPISVKVTTEEEPRVQV